MSWVFAPARSATAVRDPLVLTGKPVNRPAPMFAVPIPTISWFARTSWPVRPANADDVEIVSASETTAIPNAPASSNGMALSSTCGMVNGGRPLGRTPTRSTPLLSRSSTTASTMAAITATSTAGTFGQEAAEDHHHGDAEQPDGGGRGHGIPCGEALDERLRLGDEPVCIGREAEQLRQLADEDRQGQAVHVADLRGLGQQVGDEPETPDGPEEHQPPDHQREHRRVGDGGRRVAVRGREREHDRRDHRPERGVGPEDEDA